MANYKKISEFGNVTPVSTDLYLIEKTDGTYSYVTGTQLLSFFGAGFELTSNKQNSLSVDGTGVKFPTVDAVILGLEKKGTSYTHNSTAGLAIADNTIYFFGQETIGGTTSGNLTPPMIRSKGIIKTGTINNVVISMYVANSSTVTAETSNVYLRNHTTGTNHLLGTITFRNTASVSFSQLFSGLNIPVTIKDDCSTIIETPAFATNPTGTYIHVDYLIE